MTVVGVDGWKDGWVAAWLDGQRLIWRAYPQPAKGLPPRERAAFRNLLADFSGALIAVDIPIGSEDGPRAADEAATKFLGTLRSSIFPSPTTSTIAAFESHGDHRRAMAERGDHVAGTSIQAWNLIPKIIEVREALASTARSRVLEAHPECSFRALDTRVAASTKKTGTGQALRLRALRERAGYDVDMLTLAYPESTVPADDLLDAAVLVWTGCRVGTSRGGTLPEHPAPGEAVIHV